MYAPSRLLCSRLAAAAIMASAACALSAPAEASLPKQPFMPVGASVEPPYGYFDYCHRKASFCAEFGGAEASKQDQRAIGANYWDLVFQPQQAAQTTPQAANWVMADLSPEDWRAVAEINRRVNDEVASDSDEAAYKKRDFWALPRFRKGKRYGDCEDYVLQKRAELIAAGVPEGALSIAIAKTRRREVHAVLLIATPSGEFVLDNRSAWISRWYEVNYRWERRQIPGSQSWVRVNASA